MQLSRIAAFACPSQVLYVAAIKAALWTNLNEWVIIAENYTKKPLITLFKEN